MLDILFFSRGRGRGHAVRDLAIADELRNIDPAVAIEFASYGVGHQVIAEAGERVHDLDLPEQNPFPETVQKAAALNQRLKPRLVVAHEETAALVASAVSNVRALFTTNWFPRVPRGNYHALEYAHRVLFMENPGLFDEPDIVSGRITYCGPVLRKINADQSAASKVRASFGLTTSHTLITVAPGSPPEAREPIFDIVMTAFELLSCSPKFMVWVAGKDHAMVNQSVSHLSEIAVLESTQEMDALILASDVLITKGTYNLSREIMALGRPSISLSHGFNWVDDFFSMQWPNNIPLAVEALKSSSLAARIELLTRAKGAFRVDSALLSGVGVRRVATEIVAELNDLAK